jgi:hypothetical protein
VANKVSFLIQFKDKFTRNAEKLKRQMRGIDRSTKKADRSMQKFALRAKKAFSTVAAKATRAGAVMTAALTLPISLLGKNMISAASDAEETANKFKEVFKGIDTESSAAVKNLGNSFKLATSTSQELLSSTGDLLVGLGLSRKEALKLSTDVVKLSADVASFKNVQGGTERASIALTKALLGEREMLKETFKTAVLEEEVKKRAAIISRKNRKLTEQQAKAMAVLAIVTERNKDAIGDFNRTQEQYANQVRINQERNKELRESFGRLMLPIATKFIKALTKFFNWLNNLSKPMKLLILSIAALVAIGGPLLLLIGGIAAGLALISAAALPIIGVIALLGVAAFMLFANWNEVVGGLKAMWSDFKDFLSGIADSIGNIFVSLFEGRLIDAIKNWANVGIKLINAVLKPLDFIWNLFGITDAGTFKIPEFKIDAAQIEKLSAQAPNTIPLQNNNSSFNGQITISAEPGTVVKSNSLQTFGQANIGMNMVN